MAHDSHEQLKKDDAEVEVDLVLIYSPQFLLLIQLQEIFTFLKMPLLSLFGHMQHFPFLHPEKGTPYGGPQKWMPQRDG